eukprot:sb/3462180/
MGSALGCSWVLLNFIMVPYLSFDNVQAQFSVFLLPICNTEIESKFRHAKTQARFNFTKEQPHPPVKSKRPSIKKQPAKLHSCKDCDYQTNVILSLYDHHAKHHGESNAFKCTVCPEVRTSRHYLMKHVDEEHGGWEQCRPVEEKERKEGVVNQRDEEEEDVKEIEEDGDVKEGEEEEDDSVEEDVEMVGRILQGDEDGDKEFQCLDAKCSYTTKSRTAFRRHVKKRHKNKLGMFASLNKRLEGYVKKGPPYGPYLRPRKKKEKKWLCEHEGCGYKTVTEWHLVNHRRMHTGEKPFQCEEEGCERRFSKLHSLRRHVETVHCTEKTISCDQCEYKCASKDYLRQHTAHKHGTKKSCPYCTYRTCRNIEPHITKLHPHTCGECEWEFRSESEVTEHKGRHVVGVGIRCEHCTVVAGKEDLLIHYRTTHNVELRFKLFFSRKESAQCIRPSCDKCDYEFETVESWQKHKTLHTEGGGVKCEVCGVACADMASVLTHLRDIHQINIPDGDPRPVECVSLSCNICGHEFYSPATLRRHIALHQPDGSIKCSHCPFIAPNMVILVQHDNMDHYQPPTKRRKPRQSKGQATHLCRECGISFESASSLKLHIRVDHSIDSEDEDNIGQEHQVLEFRCPACGWLFEGKSDADQHIQCHLPDGTLSCSLCVHRAGSMDSLVTHMKVAHNLVLRAKKPSAALLGSVPPSFLFHSAVYAQQGTAVGALGVQTGSLGFDVPHQQGASSHQPGVGSQNFNRSSAAVAAAQNFNNSSTAAVAQSFSRPSCALQQPGPGYTNLAGILQQAQPDFLSAPYLQK